MGYRLKELLEKRARSLKDIEERLGKKESSFKARLLAVARNNYNSYDKQVMDFGSGLPIFKITYTGTLNGRLRTMEQYWQADDEAEAILAFNTQYEGMGFVLEDIKTIHLRSFKFVKVSKSKTIKI